MWLFVSVVLTLASPVGGCFKAVRGCDVEGSFCAKGKPSSILTLACIATNTLSAPHTPSPVFYCSYQCSVLKCAAFNFKRPLNSNFSVCELFNTRPGSFYADPLCSHYNVSPALCLFPLLSLPPLAYSSFYLFLLLSLPASTSSPFGLLLPSLPCPALSLLRDFLHLVSLHIVLLEYSPRIFHL